MKSVSGGRGDRRGRVVRVLVAAGLVAAGLVSVPSDPVGAIPPGFAQQPPERLYMMPDDPDDGWLLQAIVSVVIPIGSMTFVSTPAPDVVSMDDREIVLDFTDTEDLPGSPPPCSIVDVPGSVGFNADYDVGNCTRIQMEVSHGTLNVGPLTKVWQDDPDGSTHDQTNPAYAVYLTQSGARVDISDTAGFDAGDDYDDNNGVTNLDINGTRQQLNDALELLEYTPDPDLDDDGDANERDFYKFEGTNPETLRIDLVTEGEGIFEWDVDIRVLGGNDWPDLEGAWELGDTGSDGPADQTNVDPGAELVIPTGYDVTDADNDDAIDSFGPDGELGGGDDVDDPDGTDGAGDDMLLIGALDCGVDPQPGYGFHFSSSSMAPVGDTLVGTLNFVLGIGAPVADPGPGGTPEQQAEFQQYNNKVAARDAFFVALAPTGISDTTLQIGPILDYSTFWAGIGEIDDLQDALENIYVTYDVPNGSCDMLVIISDLGNNGVPTQYFSDPDLRQYGVELPFFGVDWDEFTVATGDATEIDVSFVDPATPLIVNEFGTAEAVVRITPAVHPAFTFAWSTEDGSATDPDDYLRQDTTVFVSENLDPMVTEERILMQFVKGGDGDEPNENFTFQIDPSGGSVPPGYVITSNSPTKNVVIPGTGPQRDVLSVTGGMVTEGDTLTKSLPFTITLDGPADGIETVEVDTSSVSPSDAGTDYVELMNQIVTFAPGETTAIVDVEVNGDFEIEPDDVVTLTVTPDPATVGGGQVSGNGTIQNDDTAPTVTVTPAATQETPTNDDPVVFTATFDRAVTGFSAAADVDLQWTGTDGETLVPTITPVTSSVYTISVTGMTSNGTITASIPAGAAADTPGGRPNEASPADAVVEWDITGPTVTINQGPLQADPTSLAPITFVIEFSEPVTGFADSEVTLSGTAGADTVQLSGAGSSYTAQVSGMANDGTVIANIAADVVVDTLGNGNEAATFTDNEVYFDLDEGDLTEPSVTIDQAVGQTDPTAGTPVLFTAVFSEPVTGFDTAADLDLSQSTLVGTLTPTITNSGDNMTYTVAVAVSGATADGIVEIDVVAGAAQDSASNLSLASTSTDNQVTFDVDTVQPTVTIDQAVGQADPTTVDPVLFTAVFSEPVTGFTNADVVLANGTGGTLTATVTPTPDPLTYAVSVEVTSPTMTGDITASIPAGAAQDANNNNSTASTSTDNVVTFQLDTDPPTVTIEQAAGQVDPTSNSPVLFTATFDEAVNGFTSGDLTLTNATGGSLSPTVAATADPLVYDVSVAVAGATTTGAITASIAAATVTDLAGNPNQASTSADNSVTFEVPVPQPLSLAIQVPANIVRDADPNQNGAIVTYPAPTTTGGTPPVSIACSHQSGDFYPIGVTTVTCTATDSALDRPPMLDSLMDDPITVVAALTASGTFTITVNQAQPTTTVPGETPASTTIPGSVTPGATLPPQLFPPSGGPGPVPAGGPVGGLPETGSNVADILAVATTALVLGAVLMLIRRRRPAPN